MSFAAYFVFSVGNLTPVFEEEYPRCWRSHETCSKALLSSIHYTQASATCRRRCRASAGEHVQPAFGLWPCSLVLQSALHHRRAFTQKRKTVHNLPKP